VDDLSSASASNKGHHSPSEGGTDDDKSASIVSASVINMRKRAK
jgi:hypothetical protein